MPTPIVDMCEVDLAQPRVEPDRHNTAATDIEHLADLQRTEVPAKADATDRGEEWRTLDLRQTAINNRLMKYLHQKPPHPHIDDILGLHRFRQLLLQLATTYLSRDQRRSVCVSW